MHVSKRTALAAAGVAAIAFAIPALAKPTGPTEPTSCAKDVQLSISQNLLWPPNHKMVPVTITGTDNEGDGDNVTMTVGTITNSDQVNGVEINGSGKPDASADTDQQGSGATTSFTDGQGTSSGSVTVDLAAERSGHDNGSGRTYTIPVTCTESGSTTDSGETDVMPAMSTVNLQVFVPHDQGNNG